MSNERQRIAVIGAGVSGLTAAWLLAEKHDVEIFEANDYAGGHTNTEYVEADGRTWPVNTGFIVFNDWTYPNFIRLMERLGVPSEVSEMSFSVDSSATGLQYNGTSLNSLFAQRKNLLNLPFLNMVREILRFNKETRADMAAGRVKRTETLGEYLSRNGYSRYFRNNYIVPMGAAIWSAPEIVLEQFPIRFFLQFFNNHGMLSVDDRPTWRVISGGSEQYVKAMMERLGDRTHLNTPVQAVSRSESGVTIDLSPLFRYPVQFVSYAPHRFRSERVSAANQLGNPFVRKLVCQLVIWHTRMAFNPMPVNLVLCGFQIKFAPQVVVFHRFFRRGFPAVSLPARKPLGNTFTHILRIGIQLDLAAAIKRFQSLNRSHQLHSVICGLALAAMQGFAGTTVAEHNAPAAGARIAFAGAIGIHNYLFGH